MLGNKIGVLIDEFVFSGAFFQAETEHMVEEKDSTTFGVLATSAEPGLASDKLMLRGYYSGYQAGSVYRELRARMGAVGVNTPVAILIDTDDIACVAECSPNAWGQSLKISLAAAELITFDLNTPPAGRMFAGMRILDATVNATNTQTPIAFEAGSTAGGAVFMFIQAIDGTATNASIKVQSATTQGGTYTDEATITINGVGGYFMPFSGAVNRWQRVNVVSLGGATSLKIVAIACIKGVTY